MTRKNTGRGKATKLPATPPTPPPPVTSVVETDAQGGADHPVTVLPPQVAYGRIQVSESIETHFSTVPMPAPESLARLKTLYPDAPKVIFGQMQAQAKHRQSIEASNLASRNARARWGQFIAAWLGTVGLIGSLIVVDRGHDWAGATIATGTLVSLVSLFLQGQFSQQKNLVARQAIRAKMGAGRPVEEVESPSSDAITPATSAIPGATSEISH